jgi:hypothetical protein
LQKSTKERDFKITHIVRQLLKDKNMRAQLSLYDLKNIEHAYAEHKQHLHHGLFGFIRHCFEKMFYKDSSEDLKKITSDLSTFCESQKLFWQKVNPAIAQEITAYQSTPKTGGLKPLLNRLQSALYDLVCQEEAEINKLVAANKNSDPKITKLKQEWEKSTKLLFPMFDPVFFWYDYSKLEDLKSFSSWFSNVKVFNEEINQLKLKLPPHTEGT